jgi:hypothetical protein
VGDTGPGGGIVFYVQASGDTFTSTGSPCNTAGVGGISTCKYLEAAPTTGNSAWTDVVRSWATDTYRTTTIPGADGTDIGNGYQNTSDIIAQSDNVAATSAAVEASEYRGPNSRTDWFLPSRDELNALCKYARNTGQAAGVDACSGGSSPTDRGFRNGGYWSSSEFNSTDAWTQYFNSGSRGIDNKANDGTFDTFYVRPIRAC